VPVLYRQSGLDDLGGLGDEAKRARDEIRTFVGVVDATARRFEERRAARNEIASAVGS
jgi:hypothetical protein